LERLHTANTALKGYSGGGIFAINEQTKQLRIVGAHLGQYLQKDLTKLIGSPVSVSSLAIPPNTSIDGGGTMTKYFSSSKQIHEHAT
jgi:hypothetical protein